MALSSGSGPTYGEPWLGGLSAAPTPPTAPRPVGVAAPAGDGGDTPTPGGAAPSPAGARSGVTSSRQRCTGDCSPGPPWPGLP